MSNRLCIVVPCYNEEEVIDETNRQLLNLVNQLVEADLVSPTSAIMYVDDGSADTTWQKLQTLSTNYSKQIICVKLSRNCGHQNALYAGLMEAKKDFDITISIDADLQDDLGVIEKFITSYNMGHDIVYGVRRERTSDSFFKRTTALLFYKLMNKLGVDVIYNHADYRLMSKRALGSLSEFKESNLFLRGIIPQLGYKTAMVYYDRLERLAGESKYNLSKMFTLAFNGITSFSVKPIRLITITGGCITGLGMFYLAYIIFEKLLGHTVSGWTSMIISIWILGGFQIISIGLIGEYIGRIYTETKRRPKYIIENVLSQAKI